MFLARPSWWVLRGMLFLVIRFSGISGEKELSLKSETIIKAMVDAEAVLIKAEWNKIAGFWDVTLREYDDAKCENNVWRSK